MPLRSMKYAALVIVVQFFFFSALCQTIKTRGLLSSERCPDDLNLSVFDTEISGDIQIVGLGEVSHGAFEPIAFKAKMVKYLIEEKGYRNVLFEFRDFVIAGMRAFLVNAEETNLLRADTLVKGMATIPASESVLCDLFRWIKRYNLNHPSDLVNISGFDIAGTASFFDYFWYNYLIPYDPVFAQKILYRWAPPGVTDSVKLLDVMAWYQDHNAYLADEISADEFNLLGYHLQNVQHRLQHASIMEEEKKAGGGHRAYVYRDSVMADNIKNLAASAKAIVWAHNGHIFRGQILMGFFLNRMYEKKYYALLTDFSKTAKVSVPAGTQLGIGGDERYIEKEFQSASASLARNILLNHDRPCGVFFRGDPLLSATFEVINVIDLHGLHSLIGAKDDAFDALVVFPAIHPDAPLNKKRPAEKEQ